eukprot:161948-Pyramimonas_sp.AAC.1
MASSALSGIRMPSVGTPGHGAAPPQRALIGALPNRPFSTRPPRGARRLELAAGAGALAPPPWGR